MKNLHSLHNFVFKDQIIPTISINSSILKMLVNVNIFKQNLNNFI